MRFLYIKVTMRYCTVPFYYVKIGLGSMPDIFLRTVLKVNRFMLLTIILNVEDGVNKYLGEWE